MGADAADALSYLLRGVYLTSVFYVCGIGQMATTRENVGRNNVNRGGQAMGHAHVANRDSRSPRHFPAHPSLQQDHRGHSAV